MCRLNALELWLLWGVMFVWASLGGCVWSLCLGPSKFEDVILRLKPSEHHVVIEVLHTCVLKSRLGSTRNMRYIASTKPDNVCQTAAIPMPQSKVHLMGKQEGHKLLA